MSVKRHGAIHENAQPRHYSREEPIESKEGHENDDRRARIGQEHQRPKNPRDALKQKKPPNVCLLVDVARISKTPNSTGGLR